MSLNENKAGGTSPDADDYNAVVDAVVALQAGGGGGSQPLDIVRVPFAFDTPNILTGVEIDTPNVGDIILFPLAVTSISAAFNGTFPVIHVLQAGAPGPDDILNRDATSVDPDYSDGSTLTVLTSGSINLLVVNDTTPIRLLLDAVGGGDPGSTAGEGEVVLTILRAS